MEPLHLYLVDDQFPNKGFNHVRTVVRGVILNSQNQICLIHLRGDDMFGHRDYYELPGGGVKEGEDLVSALRRELHEEVGASFTNPLYIGEVEDFYNLIKRKNLNHYFLVYQEGPLTPLELEDYEKTLFIEEVWVSLEEAINLFKTTVKTPISTLVYNRELPILLRCQELLAKEHE